jgi:mannonate dehydratase
MPEVTLNLARRDQKIEEYLNYIRYSGKAGIPCSTYAHMGNGIWRSGLLL